LIHNDPESARALEELRKRPLFEPEHISKLTRNEVRVLRSDHLVSTRDWTEDLGVTMVLEAGPPFPFTGYWWEGNPPFEGFSHHDGHIVIDARSGLIDGGASGFVSYHAKVGVPFTAPGTVMTVYAWSLMEPAGYRYQMASIGIGSNATTEFGLEMTVNDDAGEVVAGGPWTWCRMRISGTESASGQFGPVDFGLPADLPYLSWTSQPGREYTVNVGMWAFTDRSTGIGVAAVQSAIQGIVKNIWVAF
jgi:hypothetical protein